MNDLKPSDMNPARWLSFKIKFLPRLTAFINGEKLEEDKSYENAKEVFKE